MKQESFGNTFALGMLCSPSVNYNVNILNISMFISTTEVSFARQVSESEEISFDELSARRSTRGRSLSNGSLAVSKSGEHLLLICMYMYTCSALKLHVPDSNI